jgi:hypothetical protein
MKKINFCRNCKCKKIKKLFSLGNLNYSGKFPLKDQKIPSTTLTLVMCNDCKLVQLQEKFSLKYLYNEDYGYRTGINKTMKSHVKKVVNYLSNKVHLNKNDNVLDIASNDGTLLKNYKKNIIKWGIDPIIHKKFVNNYKNIHYTLSNFFNYNSIIKINSKVQFKIITALSVFYDLEDPNIFLNDVKKLLHKNGIFYLEFADLKLILQKKMFDTICHEHLEYYSVNFIFHLLKKHNLRIFDHHYNSINGGSSSYLICHEDAKFQSNNKKIDRILKEEKRIGVEKVETYIKFKKDIDILGKNLNNIVSKILKKKKIIHGYAASTKGNILLQYYNLNSKKIKFISDRNSQKFGLITPGTNIPIISEKKSRSLKPDYYLVLAWHFKKEILNRENKIRMKGTKFIFPLPKIEIL